MRKNEPFSIAARRRSFLYAIAGLKTFFANEHNSVLHLAGTISVIVLAFLFKITGGEAMAIVFATGFVWVAELFNTAIEKIMDFLSTETKPEIKYIKDLSAAAVLLAAVSAFITGLLVFLPKLLP